MPRPIVFTHLDQVIRAGGAARLACAPGDASRFAHRRGEPIIVADITPGLSGGYVASGILGIFLRNPAGAWQVEIENLQPFAMDVPLETVPDAPGMAEIADELFETICAAGPMIADEAVIAYDAAEALDPFSAQLSRQQQRRCAFSDVTSHKGKAVIIRPLDHGGTWQIGNFLFLDPEPANLFSAFAWTIGPRLEILIDAYAITPDIADTVNRTGMLAISDKAIPTLDRQALAWHRQQFFNRLRG